MLPLHLIKGPYFIPRDKQQRHSILFLSFGVRDMQALLPTDLHVGEIKYSHVWRNSFTCWLTRKYALICLGLCMHT
jgi:hypothetical protein